MMCIKCSGKGVVSIRFDAKEPTKLEVFCSKYGTHETQELIPITQKVKHTN